MKKKLSIVLIALALVACMTAVVCLAGCNKINKDNVNSTAEANWNGTANRTATSVVSIEDLRLSLGEENYLSLNLKATLERKIQGNKVTLTATFSDIEIADFQLGGDLSSLTTMLGSNLENLGSLLSGFVPQINNIDMNKLDEVSIKAVVNYDKEAKELRLPELKILNASGLIDADFNYADGTPVNLDNFDLIKVIKLFNGGYDLVVDMNVVFNIISGDVANIVEQILGTSLNIEEMVNNIFFGQTLINIEADKSKAEFADNTFTNKVGGYDTLSFLLDPIRDNIKPGTEDGLYEMLQGFPIIDDDTVGGRFDAAIKFLTDAENPNKIDSEDITAGHMKSVLSDEILALEYKDGVTVANFFANHEDSTPFITRNTPSIVTVQDDEDYDAVIAVIIKEGLYVRDIFNAIGGDNAIETLLGFFNFGSSNVTANYNGNFFDKITVKTTGVEINVPSKLLNKAIDIIGDLTGTNIRDLVGGILDGALLGLYDTVLGNGVQLSIGSVNVANTYAAN